MYISPDQYSTFLCQLFKSISKYTQHIILFNKTCEKLREGNLQE